jgi:peptidoglycan/LPS O-acetylase OafA/YrhL
VSSPDAAGRRPGLDGLRGVAILLVILDHAEVTAFRGTGGMGVTLFFSLSGYLITGLLLDEVARTGRIDFKGFYLRRARRLLPALVVMLAVTVWHWGFVAVPSAVVTLLYIANLPASSDQVALFGALHHMWSLAVEEQFYLLWPLVLLGLARLARGHRLTSLLLILTAVACTVRVLGYPVMGYDWTYRATLPNLFPLLAGAALAGLRRSSSRVTWTAAPGVLGPLLLVALVVAPVPVTDTWMIARTCLTVVAAALLLDRDDRWMSFAPLRYCGRISYGWYLWHVFFQLELGGLTGSVVSFAVAVASWHLWESRWVRPRAAQRQRGDMPSLASAA